MSLLRVLPAQFSLLLLAALFMRLGFPLILIVPLTLMLMLAALVPWPEVRGVMTVVMGLGSLIWLLMTWARVAERAINEEPWSRLAAILAGVAVFTAWSGWLLWSGRDAAPETICADQAEA